MSFRDLPLKDMIYFLKYYNADIPINDDKKYLETWNQLLKINNTNKLVPQSIANWVKKYNLARGYAPNLMLPDNIILNMLNFSDINSIISLCSTNNDYYNLCKQSIARDIILSKNYNTNIDEFTIKQKQNLFNILTDNISGKIYRLHRINENNMNALSLYDKYDVKNYYSNTKTEIILLTNGDVYGYTYDNRYGIISENGKFIKLNIENIREVAIGNKHILFLNNDNEVFSIGNPNGQTNNIDIKKWNLNKIETISSIKSIAVADTYSLFLD